MCGGLVGAGVAVAHSGSLLPVAFLSAQRVHVEHTAQLHGIHFSSSLQRETSDYYRLLTPALQTLVSAAGTEIGGSWVGDWGGQSGTDREEVMLRLHLLNGVVTCDM